MGGRSGPYADGRTGQTTEDLGRRADRALARVAPLLAASEEDGVLVTHAHLLRALTARYLGLPPSEGRLFLLATARVGRLSTEYGLPVVSGWNQRPLPPFHG
ncbi:histidine phosphatase family protein [Streptomyces venezuelae]|uniref:histidine phosphatase family protein n=1 Tax=Streptomyces TaxID=1883 RepID=UPI0039892B7E